MLYIYVRKKGNKQNKNHRMIEIDWFEMIIETLCYLKIKS
jgi:hypothetical protein